MKKRIKSYWSNCLSIAAIICSVISLIRCEPFAFTDSCLSWVIGISIALTSIGVVIILGYQIYNSATLDKRMKEMFDERTNKVKEDLSISAARASAATLYQATGIGIKVDYVTKDFSGMIRTLKTMLEYAINLNDAETLSDIARLIVNSWELINREKSHDKRVDSTLLGIALEVLPRLSASDVQVPRLFEMINQIQSEKSNTPQSQK